MKDNLKPCPFCNKDKVGIDKRDGKYRVICINPNCHIEPFTNWQDTKQKAIDDWNRRVENESN